VSEAQTKWEDGDEWRIVRSHAEADTEASGGAATGDRRAETSGGNESQNNMTLDEMLEAIRE
jgi:hypothetical protein